MSRLRKLRYVPRHGVRLYRLGEVDASGTDEPAWYDVWGKLKQYVTQLDQAVASLQKNRDYALSRPELADTYLAKMDEVESIRDKAIWLRDKIREVMSYVGVDLQGLGVLPVLAAALWPVVAAGVAWLGVKALDLWKFSMQVDEQRRLEAKGVSPEQAAAIAAKTAESGSLSSALGNLSSSLVVVGALGVGAWLFWKSRRRGG